MTTGAKIKAFIDENGIKQGFVAEKAGLTASNMSDICKGRVKSIDCGTYYKICKALNVPFEKFLEE